ncbi:LptE family protein [Salegentibacter sp. HM20]
MRTKTLNFLAVLLIAFSFSGCGFYSFTGADTGAAQTFQVNFFQNNADLVEPGIDRDFTLRLQDLIQNQTRLSLVNDNADLIFEGEIINYYISPMSATADNRAAENRLTIGINVRYYNNLEPEKDFERRFSFYFDYDANAQLVGPVLDTALDEIFTRLTQDVFNAALANW